MVWENTTRKYELRNARIVAMIDGGGAMIETGDFVYREGRSPMSYGDDATDDPPALETVYSFETPDSPMSDSLVSVEARIVIDGEGEAGRIEIRGNGWIGYDEHGLVSGWFDEPPKMLLDHGAQMPEYPPIPGHELSRAEWIAHMEVTNPRTSAEFERAARSRDGIEDDDDD